MATQGERCALHISISSREETPEPRRPSIISISSGDGSPRPNKRRRVDDGPGNAKDDGLDIDNNETAAIEAQQMEIMRSLVDEGIRIATEEARQSGLWVQSVPLSKNLPEKFHDELQKSKPSLPIPSTPQSSSPSTMQNVQNDPIYARPRAPSGSYASPHGYANPLYPQTYPRTPTALPNPLNKSIHAPASVYPNPRPALGTVSGNIVRTVHKAPLDSPHILAPHMYLSFYDLENIYCPDIEDWKRSAWLSKIGLHIEPFNSQHTAAYKRQEVEDAWLHLLPHTRRVVEHTAVMWKYNTKIHLDAIPVRTVPPELLPLRFYDLERHYFRVPARKLTDYHDAMKKRSTWLRDLNLHRPLFHSLCTSQAQEEAVERLYISSYTVAERRAIQAKAAYLRVMLDPPRPSWVEFEKQYFLLSRIKTEAPADFETRRRGWLSSLGLNCEPFYLNPSNTAFGKTLKEKVEVCWNDLGQASRANIVRTAGSNNETVLKQISWASIEPSIGYVSNRDFPGAPEEYHRTRERWLNAIGMKATGTCTAADLDSIWTTKSFAWKEALVGIAKNAKQEIDDELAAARVDMRRQLEAKARAEKLEAERAPAKRQAEALAAKSKLNDPMSYTVLKAEYEKLLALKSKAGD